MKINIRKFLSALFCLLVLLSVYSCTYSVKDPGSKDNPTAADDYAPISQLSKSLLPEERQDLSKAKVLNSLAELSLPEFGDGVLRIDALQMAGKKRMDAAAFLNGMRNVETNVME